MTHLIGCQAPPSHRCSMRRTGQQAGRCKPRGCEADVLVGVARKAQRGGAASRCTDGALQRAVAARSRRVCQPERGAAQRARVLPASLRGGSQLSTAQCVEARKRQTGGRKESVHQRCGVRRKRQHKRQRHGRVFVARKRVAGGCARRLPPCGAGFLAPLYQPPQQVQQPRAERADSLESRRRRRVRSSTCGGSRRGTRRAGERALRTASVVSGRSSSSSAASHSGCASLACLPGAPPAVSLV